VTFGPIWRSLYLPMLGLALADVAWQIVRLLRPQWARFRSIVRIILCGLDLISSSSSLWRRRDRGWSWRTLVISPSHADCGHRAGVSRAPARHQPGRLNLDSEVSIL
jgi:hypothetical protein